MSATNLFAAISYVAEIVELARSKGITLEVSTDFEEFRKVRTAQRERQSLYPMYDPACSYVDLTNGFWIKGTDEEDGTLVHTQAMRLLDLTDMTLAEHLRLHRHKYMTPGDTDDPTEFDFSPTPAAQRITGRVCYHGELWMSECRRGARGAGLTTILPHMALALAHMEWSPDYVFGFMYPMAACKGLAAREGYMHMEPGAWHVPGNCARFPEWIVWMARDDLKYLMRFPPKDLFQEFEAHQAAKNNKPKTAPVAEVPRRIQRPRTVAVS